VREIEDDFLDSPGETTVTTRFSRPRKATLKRNLTELDELLHDDDEVVNNDGQSQ
jgi:hypothetical protein